MTTQECWMAPDAAYADLHKESAKFLFDAAEKRLKNLLDVSDRTTNRAIGTFGLLIPLLGFLLAALFKHYFGKPTDQLAAFLLAVCWLSSWVCLISIGWLYRTAFPRDMHQMGREPRLLLNQELLTNEYYQGEKQYTRLLVAEIEDLQDRIRYMQAQSNQRVADIKKCFTLLAWYAGFCLLVLTVWGLFQWLTVQAGHGVAEVVGTVG